MAKKKPPRKSIDDKIAAKERELNELKRKSAIDKCDHPKEVKALIKAADILRAFTDLDEDNVVSEGIMEAVEALCPIEEE